MDSSRPTLRRIRLYPIKSLDPIEVTTATIGTQSLKYDRAFAMIAKNGRYINGKRTGRVNQLKTTYNLEEQTVTFSPREGDEQKTFRLAADNPELVNYLSDFFELDLELRHSTAGELMDIPTTSCITIVSTATLQSLQQDMSTHTLDDLRLRFRTNLEIADTSPYWEEQLFQQPGVGVRFRIGEVELVGVSPRARCNVPPRDPFTGEPDRTFMKKMMKSRGASLPSDSLLYSYGSLYQLTTNVYVSEKEAGKTIKLGDVVEILAPVLLGR